MSLDIFGDINRTEEAMRAAKAEAAAIARKMLANAEAEGLELIAKAEKEAEAEVEKMLADADRTGERAASELASSTENKRAVTRTGVEKRLDKAVDYIVGRIVNG
ncbi:MAG: hypothetical protein PUB32_09785 [Clostridiales bacterium]|nr:hypothetical protein [Clostridiales bacterium]